MEPKVRVAVLNDYQGVARSFGDWSRIEARCDVTVFRDGGLGSIHGNDATRGRREETVHDRDDAAQFFLAGNRVRAGTGGLTANVDDGCTL